MAERKTVALASNNYDRIYKISTYGSKSKEVRQCETEEDNSSRPLCIPLIHFKLKYISLIRVCSEGGDS